jgi:hypothetical protein
VLSYKQGWYSVSNSLMRNQELVAVIWTAADIHMTKHLRGDGNNYQDTVLKCLEVLESVYGR